MGCLPLATAKEPVSANTLERPLTTSFGLPERSGPVLRPPMGPKEPLAYRAARRRRKQPKTSLSGPYQRRRDPQNNRVRVSGDHEVGARVRPRKSARAKPPF